mmetsp:Transcript_86923/g.270249  ORF Transcript_86923/g.270249 Transcript_86923/m.270249 type:complete len:249 (+) Transcript_86923:116-862(+)
MSSWPPHAPRTRPDLPLQQPTQRRAAAGAARDPSRPPLGTRRQRGAGSACCSSSACTAWRAASRCGRSLRAAGRPSGRWWSGPPGVAGTWLLGSPRALWASPWVRRTRPPCASRSGTGGGCWARCRCPCGSCLEAPPASTWTPGPRGRAAPAASPSGPWTRRQCHTRAQSSSSDTGRASGIRRSRGGTCTSSCRTPTIHCLWRAESRPRPLPPDWRSPAWRAPSPPRHPCSARTPSIARRSPGQCRPP